MALDNFLNLALGQVATAPSPPSSGASLTLATGQGTRFPAPPFNCTVFPASAIPDPTNAEIIRVTAKAGDVFSTILRAQESTLGGPPARAIQVGDNIALTFSAKWIVDLTDASNLSAGTIPTARIPTVLVVSAPTAAPIAQVRMQNLAAPAGLQMWRVVTNTLGQMLLQTMPDDQSSALGPQFQLEQNGNLKLLGQLAVAGSATPNVARLDVGNSFAGDQTISKGAPSIVLTDGSQPVDARVFRIIAGLSGGQILTLQALNDAATISQGVVSMDRGGSLIVGRDVYEKGRTSPMGHWFDIPYSAGNFIASSGLWTVEAGDYIQNRYTLIGKTLILSFNFSTTTITASPGSLIMAMPPGISLVNGGGTIWYLDADGGGWKVGNCGVYNPTNIWFGKTPAASPTFVPTTNAAYVQGTVAFGFA